VSGQLYAQPLYPWGKSPWYPTDRKLGGPQGWSGCGGEKRIPSPPSLQFSSP